MVDADLEAAGLSSQGVGNKILREKRFAWNKHP